MAESMGIFSAVKGLFEYNRENFIFDRTLNQERVYQIQKMRVAQVKLYRDDLRELFSLTIRKMDSYLIFNALLLLFTGGLFYEGRLPQGTPAWLLWLWTMSLGSAFFYLSLAIWFAIHASITAQTFQVRLLTQWLRLPIPSAEDIHAVSGAATQFEETRARDMLRVPGVANRTDQFGCVEKYPDVPNDLLKSDLVQDYTLFVEHFYLFRDLQKHWQGFDAYARIGMVVGTNMLLSAFSYMSLAYFLMSFKALGGLVFPFILTGFQLIHLRINLRNVSIMEKLTIVALIVTPILLASIAGVQSVVQKNTYYGDILSPVMFAASGLWIVFLVLIGSEDDGGLPCRFVTVGSIDVLGLDEDDARFQALSPSARRKDREATGRDSTADSPSSESSGREGAETPVAVAVPPAAVINKAEERRRSRHIGNDEGSMLTSINGVIESVGGSQLVHSTVVFDDAEDETSVRLDAILESSFIAPQSAPGSSVGSGNLSWEASEGIAPVELNEEEEIGAYESAAKATRLPWKGYREAGAVLVCLWLFATTYSVLASFEHRWGWPRTLPYGDGETPIVLAAMPDSSLLSRRLMQRDGFTIDSTEYGKVNVWQADQLLKSVDIFDDIENFAIRDTNLVVVYGDGTEVTHRLPIL